MISIPDICKQYKIKNYTINSDGSIDVNGNVGISWLNITELPLTFNRVSGYFNCSNNYLTSLKGSPRWVGGSFRCSFNDLTSLEFSPDYVGGYFSCGYNNLIDNISYTEIKGKFYTSLKQDGLTEDNYTEWRKLYKRKQILNDIFNM